MALPISDIEKHNEEREISLSKALPENAENAMASLARLTGAMESSGLLTMLSAFLEHYEDTLKIVVDQVSTERTSQFINNLLTIYTLLSSIDQRRLLSIINSISNALNDADKFRTQESLGLLSMLRLLKDPDVSAGLRAAFDILGSISRKE